MHVKPPKRIRFWMTFGDEYIKHMTVLANVGMTRIDEVDYKGQKVIPMEFLKCLLPDPGSLAEVTKERLRLAVSSRVLRTANRKRLHLQRL